MPMKRNEFITMLKYETSVSRAHGRKEVYVVPSSCILSDTKQPECISVASFPVSAESPMLDDELFTDLSAEDQSNVMRWIKSHIEPTKTVNRKRCSYGLKHWLEADTGIYLSNNQFKHAMLLAGIYPVDEKQLNWMYRISERRLKNPF